VPDPRDDLPPVWRAGPNRHPSLDGAGAPVDVAVVGGGITGLTTALELLARGRSVVVLEAHTVGSGSTGRSTGKVTSQHGAIYRGLVDRHGREIAGAYATLSQDAVRRVGALVDEHAIDCDAEVVAGHVHTAAADTGRGLVEEAHVAASLGLPARLVTEAPVPYPVVAAVRFEDQLQLDPWRYVDGLAAAVTRAGGTVHEHSRVRDVRRRRGRVRVTTGAGHVDAAHVVVATLSPTVDPAATFARTSPIRAYGIATETEVPVAHDNAITADDPTYSTRRVVDVDGTELLVVVGGSHEVGTSHDHRSHHADLERHAAERWGAGRVRYRWSAQDHAAVDGLPMIGSSRLHPRVLVATGMRKWGLTLGTAAATLLAEEITGDRPHGGPFVPTRRPGVRDVPRLVAMNLANGVRLVRDRVPSPAAPAPGPGEGVVVRSLRCPVAVCTTPDGVRHAVSASCTHLGCTVRWNSAEMSWDCPCHGSRFGPDGGVLDGPADRPLRAMDDPTR
jgi:glycine/D-amino acid oxidase-like deaminating enzyme/nitrite reductase/ring-hydroxylating ferredoxin subunit